MWRNALAGSRDMYFATSLDGGKTFGEARKLGAGTWTLKACPMDGGQIAVSPQGEVFTAWRRDKDIFLTLNDSAIERRIGAGRQPWVASAQGPHVVWVQDRTGQLMYLAPGAEKPRELAAKSNDPVVISSLASAGAIVAAWEEPRGSDIALVCQVIELAK
jgi:hypothetical protein